MSATPQTRNTPEIPMAMKPPRPRSFLPSRSLGMYGGLRSDPDASSQGQERPRCDQERGAQQQELEILDARGGTAAGGCTTRRHLCDLARDPRSGATRPEVSTAVVGVVVVAAGTFVVGT